MSNFNNEHINPCVKEQELSMKCLTDTNYQHEKCELHFENYRQCKKFWGMVQKERRNKGIYPTLPPAEDREQIKAEYFQKKTYRRP